VLPEKSLPPVSFLAATALRDLRRTGGLGLCGVALSALTALAAGGIALGLDALGRLATAWQAEIRVVAILRPNGTPAGGPEALVPVVRALPGAGRVRFVPAADALAELSRYLGSVEAGLDRLAINPVPPRLEITPAAGLAAALLRELVEALRRVPGVDEVEAAIDWVGELERVQGALRAGGLILAGALSVTAVLVIRGATVLAGLRRVDETAVLRLAGVSEARLRAPLLAQAVAQGTLGAALGLAALWLASEGGSPWVASWLRAAFGLGPLPLPSPELGSALVGTGLGAGLVGGIAAGRP
jgi:cell division transport system permease protein